MVAPPPTVAEGGGDKLDIFLRSFGQLIVTCEVYIRWMGGWVFSVNMCFPEYPLFLLLIAAKFGGCTWTRGIS